MAKVFKVLKTQAAATKWLQSVAGVIIDENSKEGKWAAYVPNDKDEDGMTIGYGDTFVEAVNNVVKLLEG